MSPIKGRVFNIQKFSVDDGPGIRTTVFLKGCPLSCIWCHNPESHDSRREIFFYEPKCIGCCACVAVCEHGCRIPGEPGTPPAFDRTNCVRCGRCADVCPAGALECTGSDRTVEEVLRVVLQDRVFYEEGGGGMTLSGGEPLAQPAFSLALCEAAKREGLHVAMETSGFCSWETLEPFLPPVDLFLYDYKAEPENHRALTGVDSDRILSNLERLSRSGAEIILRCPIVPGCNDTESHYRAIADLAGRLPGIRAVNLEPYHPLGLSKAQQLGKTQPYDNPKFMEKGPLKETAAGIRDISGKPTTVNGA